MRKTLIIAIAMTIWTAVILPIGGAMLGAPWWALFIVGLFSGSATAIWWIVYADERKPYRQMRGY